MIERVGVEVKKGRTVHYKKYFTNVLKTQTKSGFAFFGRKLVVRVNEQWFLYIYKTGKTDVCILTLRK